MARANETRQSNVDPSRCPPKPHSPGSTRRGQRSKTGCQTCRTKKVKCDEQRPECARCRRLELACHWAEPYYPTRSKRWGRDRASRNLQPRPSPGRELALTPVSTSAQTTEGSNSAIVETIQLFDDAALPVDASILATPQSLIPVWEELCAPWWSTSDMGYDFQGAATITPLISSLTSSDCEGQSMPCCLPLSPLDSLGLDHYSTALTASFGPKNSRWSTLTMLQSISMPDPMLMHLLLAVALNDLWCRGKQTNSELREAARQHYDTGESLVADRRSIVFKSEADPSALATSHMHLCAAFWFMYMYQTRTPEIDIANLRRLSTTVADHVRTYGLDQLCTCGSVAGAQENAEPTVFSAVDGSLIASMIIGVYFEDVKYGFYRCGGRLARHLNSNKAQLGRVYDLGRNALALYWGAQYPIDEFIIDLNNYTNLKLHSELYILLEDINSTYSSTKPDANAQQRFTSQLEDLGARFSATLGMTAENWNAVASDQSRASAVKVVCEGVGAAYYHAIRIYIFRCTTEPRGDETPPHILKSVKIVLQIARCVLGISRLSLDAASSTRDDGEIFHRLEWPLFIAGVESQDVFYQDWIVHRMYNTRIKKALESVLEEQARIGRRVGVEFMRQAFL